MISADQGRFQGEEDGPIFHSLLNKFGTHWSNTYNDQCGGSLEERTRFSRCIIDGLGSACENDFIIGIAV